MTSAKDQPQLRRRKRDIAKWDCAHFEYENFGEFFNAVTLSTGVHSIKEKHEIVDFLYIDNSSKSLAVFFHGAVQAAKLPHLKLPIFSGGNIHLGNNADRVLFSDATMAVHNELRLGWFTGTMEFDLTKRIDQILKKISELKRHRRVLMLGGSQGGFAALRASRALEGSVALVWNPQTNIQEFSFKNHLAGFHRYAFGTSSFEQIPIELRTARHFDLTASYSAKPPSNYVVLMQNLEDKDHFENHATPLVNAVSNKDFILQTGVNRVTDRFICAIGDWVGGHSLPDRATLEKLSEDLLDSSQSIQNIILSPTLSSSLLPSFYSNRYLRAANRDSELNPEGALPMRVLSRAERNFLRSEMVGASPKWYIQYGLGNTILDAAEMGFDFVDGVDSDPKRIKGFKEKILKLRITNSQKMNIRLIALDSTHSDWRKLGEQFSAKLPSYIVKPWVNHLDKNRLPTFVYLSSPQLAPVSLYIATQCLLNPHEPRPKLFVHGGGEPIDCATCDFNKYFKVTSKVGDIFKLDLRAEIGLDEIVLHLLTSIPRTEVKFSAIAS